MSFLRALSKIFTNKYNRVQFSKMKAEMLLLLAVGEPHAAILEQSIWEDAFVMLKTAKNNKVESPSGNPEDKLLMWQLLRTFIWMDRGLQENLQRRGWPEISRTESQVMLLVSEGIQRPIDMARSLGLTRQAINQTINLLSKKNLVTMEDDPSDRRCKIVSFAGDHEDIRNDAKHILESLENELRKKVGNASIRGLKQLAKGQLGAPPEVEFPD